MLVSNAEVIIVIVVVTRIIPCSSLTVTHEPLETPLGLGVCLIVLRLVELEPKYNRDGIGFLLQCACEGEEVLIHGKGLLHVLESEVFEPSQHLPHHRLVQVVAFDKIQEEHVDEVLKQSSLPAELLVFEQMKYFCDKVVQGFVDLKALSVRLVFEDLSRLSALEGKETFLLLGNKFEHADDVIHILLRQDGKHSFL